MRRHMQRTLQEQQEEKELRMHSKAWLRGSPKINICRLLSKKQQQEARLCHTLLARSCTSSTRRFELQHTGNKHMNANLVTRHPSVRMFVSSQRINASTHTRTHAHTTHHTHTHRRTGQHSTLAPYGIIVASPSFLSRDVSSVGDHGGKGCDSRTRTISHKHVLCTSVEDVIVRKRC